MHARTRIFLTVLLLIFGVACKASISWIQFATSQLYSNFRLITKEENVFVPRYYSKDMPLVWARMECSRQCVSNYTCQAFNFFEEARAYVCEMLADNLCSNKTTRTVVPAAGCSVWNKLTDGSTRACVEPSSPMSCEILRPGCLGTWPSCVSCVQHCKDCLARYTAGGFYDCTFWPDGDGSESVPIFGTCTGPDTYLIRRVFNLRTGQIAVNYSMSLFDMHRVARLRYYSYLTFLVWTSNRTVQYTLYRNPVIEADGTLSNLSFVLSYPTAQDVLNMKSQNLPRTPFVFVTDDKYGCGSFWLFDPNNATYCPGSNVSLLGNLKAQNTETKTGMRWPFLIPGTFVVDGCVKLNP